ncbi:putative HVA22-like protein g [Wolffia australiana]
MIGSFLTRVLAMALGYAYPAYECFKIVEKNKPEIEQLRFWCQYWILVAILTVLEKFGDAFVSWLPMYSEAKLAFFIYLWYPKTRGTTYVYETFLQPIVSKHEPEIDRTLLELKTRAGDIVILYWQKAANYGQTRFFEVLQYIASQSQTPRPRPSQSRQPAVGVPPLRSSAGQQPEAPDPRPPPSPAKVQTRNPNLEPDPPAAAPSTQPLPTPRSSPAKHGAGPGHVTPAEAEAKPVESTQPSASDPAPESTMEEPVKATRGRLRKTRSGGPAAPPP